MLMQNFFLQFAELHINFIFTTGIWNSSYFSQKR